MSDLKYSALPEDEQRLNNVAAAMEEFADSVVQGTQEQQKNIEETIRSFEQAQAESIKQQIGR